MVDISETWFIVLVSSLAAIVLVLLIITCILCFCWRKSANRNKKEQEKRKQKETTADDFKIDSPTLLPSGYGTPNPLCKDSVQGQADERPYTPFSVGRTLIQMSEELDRNAGQEPQVPSVKKLGVPVLLPRNGMKAIDERYVEYNRNSSFNTKKELPENFQHGEQMVRLGIPPSRPVDWQREKSSESEPTTKGFVLAPAPEIPLYRKPYGLDEEITNEFYMQIGKSATSPTPYYLPEVDYEPRLLPQQGFSSRRNDAVKEEFTGSEVQNSQRDNHERFTEHQLVNYNKHNSILQNNSSPKEQEGNLYSQHVNGEVFFRPIVKNSFIESSMAERLAKQKFKPKDPKSENMSRLTFTNESFVNYSVDSRNFQKPDKTARKISSTFPASDVSNAGATWGQSEPEEFSKEKLRRVQKFGVSVFPE